MCGDEGNIDNCMDEMQGNVSTFTQNEGVKYSEPNGPPLNWTENMSKLAEVRTLILQI